MSNDTPTILVADDTEITCLYLKTILEEQGYRVVTAADGLEALARVEQERPALVLLDMQMPGLDGLECTTRIRALPAPFAQTIIVAISGYVMEEDRRRFRAAGVDDCLAKPIDEDGLFLRVRELLAARSPA